MTLSIGRCGLDVTSDEVESLDMDGNTVRISGILYASSLADAKVLRQQLLGHVDNPDEPVVPVAWSEDSSIDGFYRVRSASVSTTAVSYAANWFPFTVDLERVHGTTIACVAEAIQTVALRTNSYGITTASWLPVAWVQQVSPQFSFIRNATTSVAMLSGARIGDDGIAVYGSAASLFPGSAFSQVVVSPSQWYTNSCRMEVGSSFRKAVGRDIVNDLTNWRVSNGLVRFAADPTIGTKINVAWYNGSSWSTTKTFELTYGGSGYTSFGLAPKSVTILRNSPERVTVRVVTGVVIVDLSVRRGSYTVEVGITYGDGIGTLNYGIKCSTVEAATALTGGIRATANDASGNRYVLTAGGASAITNDLVNGRFYVSGAASTAWSAGIGAEVTGSSASSPNTAQEIVYQYMAVWNETLRVVSR